jgi:hypothetical protein
MRSLFAYAHKDPLPEENFPFRQRADQQPLKIIQLSMSCSPSWAANSNSTLKACEHPETLALRLPFFFTPFHE